MRIEGNHREVLDTIHEEVSVRNFNSKIINSNTIDKIYYSIGVTNISETHMNHIEATVNGEDNAKVAQVLIEHVNVSDTTLQRKITVLIKLDTTQIDCERHYINNIVIFLKGETKHRELIARWDGEYSPIYIGGIRTIDVEIVLNDIIDTPKENIEDDYILVRDTNEPILNIGSSRINESNIHDLYYTLSTVCEDGVHKASINGQTQTELTDISISPRYNSMNEARRRISIDVSFDTSHVESEYLYINRLSVYLKNDKGDDTLITYWDGKQSPIDVTTHIKANINITLTDENEIIVNSVEENKRKSWDEYFMKLAKDTSERSTCNRRQVGAVIVRNNRIISTGYNGAPKKLVHCIDDKSLCLRDKHKIPSGERLEICRAVHAEQNALLQANGLGADLEGGVIYVTTFPCATCAKMIINSGISRIVYLGDYTDTVSKDILSESNISVYKMILK